MFYLDINLTYLRLCDNETKSKLGFFQGEWVRVMTWLQPAALQFPAS